MLFLHLAVKIRSPTDISSVMSFAIKLLHEFVVLFKACKMKIELSVGNFVIFLAHCLYND